MTATALRLARDLTRTTASWLPASPRSLLSTASATASGGRFSDHGGRNRARKTAVGVARRVTRAAAAVTCATTSYGVVMLEGWQRAVQENDSLARFVSGALKSN